MAQKRNHTIDLWRFVFSLIIMFHHSRYLFGDEESIFLGGSLAVEFFFMVSGYLLMASIERLEKKRKPLLFETFEFIKKKWCGFYPEIFLAWLVSFLFVIIALHLNVKEVISRLAGSFGEPLLLYSFGLVYGDVNRATWYLSSMLLCMALLFPLIRKWPEVMKRYVMPLSVLFLWGWLCAEYGSTRNPSLWTGLTYKGNIRALFELQMGGLLYCASQKIQGLSFNWFGKVLITAAEWGGYLAAVLYMYYETASKKDILFIVLLGISITITFSQASYHVSNALLGRIFTALGRFSFPLFLCHFAYATHLNNVLPNSINDTARMTIYICSSFVTALGVMILSDQLRKNKKRIFRGLAVSFLKS